MDKSGLFLIVPLIYIVWWIWTLIATIIPWLTVDLSAISGLTLWQVIGSVIFFVIGVPVLIIAFFGLLAFIAILFSD